MTVIGIGEIELDYERTGAGPPLLLIMGMSGTALHWELAMPTLVMHGTEDQLLPVDNGRLIASCVPGSRLEIFDGAGHLFFWEQPQRSAELVREHAAVPA